jgi:tetratricopeptide (TPR) repeat protein
MRIPKWRRWTGLGLSLLCISLWLSTSTPTTLGLESIRQAERYRIAGKRTAAEQRYQQALSHFPASPYLALRLAELYKEWGRPRAGLIVLNDALERLETDDGHLSRISRDEILTLQLALLAEAQAWDTVIQIASPYASNAQILPRLTTALLHQHDCDKATDMAKRWVAMRPDDPEAQRTAWSLQRKGTPPAQLCDRTPTLCTTDTFDLGLALIHQGRWSLAACVLAEANVSAETYAWLGESLLHIDHIEQAHHYLEQATLLEPDNPLGWLLLGRYYLYTSETQAAQRALFRAHELDPQNPAPCIAMIEALAAESRYEETVAWAEAALIRAPEDPDVWKMIARIYLERDLQQNGFPMHATKEAVHIAPNDAEAQMLLGWAQLYRDDLSAALQTLERAIQLNPKLAQAHYLRGVALRRTGQNRDAHEAFTQAADLGAEDLLKE